MFYQIPKKEMLFLLVGVIFALLGTLYFILFYSPRAPYSGLRRNKLVIFILYAAGLSFMLAGLNKNEWSMTALVIAWIAIITYAVLSVVIQVKKDDNFQDQPETISKSIEKKIYPAYFGDVKKGVKTFELRKDEDDAQPGDILILKEWNAEGYTGRSIRCIVTYVLRDHPEFGLMNGYCIIGIKPLEDTFKGETR